MTARFLVWRVSREQVRDETGCGFRSALRQALHGLNLGLRGVPAIDAVSEALERLLELTICVAKIAAEVARQISTKSLGDEPRR